jgi:predicted O-linked N-acetylglucosamine transferase (SPINDLY family)
MSFFIRLPAIAAALLLAGCGTLPEQPPGNVAKPEEPLAYYRRLTRMAPDEQRREYNEALVTNERLASDESRLRLALSMLVPDAPWRDDAQLLKLLAVGQAHPTEPPTPHADLALLLERLVGERLRQLAEANRNAELLQQKMNALREEHRKVEVLKQKLEAMNEECRKTEELQKKLEGLRAIDREMRKPPARGSAR